MQPNHDAVRCPPTLRCSDRRSCRSFAAKRRPKKIHGIERAAHGGWDKEECLSLLPRLGCACVATVPDLLLSILEKRVLNRSFSTVVFTVLFSLGAAHAQVPEVNPSAAEEETATSLRLLFGLKRFTPQRWDGKISITPGRVVRVGGVHFEGRDEIKGPDEWWLTTRVTRYADSTTPRGYDPVHTAPFQMIPNGVVAVMEGAGNANVSVSTESGGFSFRLDELVIGKPKIFAGDEASAERIPATIDLTRGETYNDYPAMTASGDGSVWLSWISYANRKDGVWLRQRAGDGWKPAVPVSPAEHNDNFRTAVAQDAAGRIVVVWSGKLSGKWGLFSRSLEGGRWSDVIPITGELGENLYHTLVRDSRGNLHLAWQAFRDRNSVILHSQWDGSAWSGETVISSGSSDNWNPALAADSKGAVWVGWDGYGAGDFNIYVRRLGASGEWNEVQQITRSPAFDANVSLACDQQDRLWIAWDHGEANWGKDWTSQRFKPGGGAGLYRVRSAKIAVLDGGQIKQPPPVMDAIPAEYQDYFQQVTLQIDKDGRVWAMGRSLTSTTTRVNNNWGAGGIWEVLLTRLDGNGWLPAVKLHATNGRNDVRAASTSTPDGKLWFAWSRDARPFGSVSRPINRRAPPAQITQVSYTVVDPAAAGFRGEGSARLEPFDEPAIRVAPVHPNDPEDVAAIRAYRYEAGGKRYRILRGDLHRHTDISGDGIGDGALIDFYRYAFTAGQYDFMMVGDHQYGGRSPGLEYNWWRTEKSEDIFLVEGRFWPLFGTERSLKYPNGHRNTIFARRGIRELPISPGERRGEINTGSVLYPYLHRNGGITTSHTSGTDQGTDWRDSDPEVEPVVEIYQGLHASYEYIGAPRAATPDRRYYHHGSEWRPKGFVWEAWAKGIKLGVQASADHIATHDAYACILVDADKPVTRQDLIDGMKARHTYGATDNIILDVRIGEHIMGDAFSTSDIPVVKVKAAGTVPLSRVVVIKNNEFVYTAEPGEKESSFEFRDEKIQEGESYYYVRVEQSDGSLAWSSPIRVNYQR